MARQVLILTHPAEIHAHVAREVLRLKGVSADLWYTADLPGRQTASLHLPDPDILQSTPGIFQQLVPKAYELRVTAIGHRLFAAKLRSQEVEAGLLDWRRATARVPMEPFSLPAAVESACLEVLADLEIVYGSFDLIVTLQGDFVFLEVNEMGAFLWIEERLPELGILDAFTEFLIQGRVDFAWQKPSRGSAAWLPEISTAVQKMQEEARRAHVITSSGLTFQERLEDQEHEDGRPSPPLTGS